VIVQYPDGRQAFFTESAGSYSAPFGNLDGLVKNVGDTFTLTTALQFELDFDSNGLFTSITDRNGNSTDLTYTSGDLTKVTDAAGRDLDFTYTSGRITKITGPLSREVEYAYSADGDLISVTDVRDGVTEFTYAEHRLLTIEDTLNNVVVTNVYDGAGRVVEQTDAEDGVTCFYYGTTPAYTSTDCTGVTPAADAGETIVVDPRGGEETHQFDNAFRPTAFEDAEGGVTIYTYETSSVECNDGTTDLGYLCTIKDSLDHETNYTYDDTTGNRLTVKNALNKTWTYTYNSLNEILTATDPLSNVTTYVYDADGDLTSVTNDLSDVITYTPNSDGTLASVTDDLGHNSTHTYDANGLPASITSAEGETTTFEYDDGGRMSWLEDAVGDRTSYTYDNHNNALTITDAVGNVTTFTYDAAGQRTKITDPNGFETDLTYDKAGRLLTATDELGQVVSYAYDGNGNRISMTNPRRVAVSTPESGTDCGAAGTGDGDDDDSDSVIDDGCPSIIYTYDDADRLATETDSLGKTTTFVFDAAGRVTSRNDNKSAVTTYTYFDDNSLKKIDYPVGTTDVSFTYDDVGNRKTMIDDSGTTTYTYDDLYRPTTINDGDSNEVDYAYDDAGRLTSITYPGIAGDQVTYTYDDANRLTGVSDWLNNDTSYTYDNAGRLAATTYPTGVSTSYSYDSAGRALSLQNSTSAGGLSASDYLVDPAGMRTRLVTESATDYRQAVLDDGPVAYWRLGETSGTNADDETANNNDGTYANSPTLDQAGAITGDPDGSVDFDGTDDSISVAGSSSLDGLNAISADGWFYLDGWGENSLGRFFARSGGNQLFFNDSCDCFYFEALRWSTDGKWKTATDSIELGRWYHVAVTYDYGSTSNDPILYIDGESVTVGEVQTPSGTLTGPDTATLYIGNVGSRTTITCFQAQRWRITTKWARVPIEGPYWRTPRRRTGGSEKHQEPWL
jgi:YD repeat-containing protein